MKTKKNLNYNQFNSPTMPPARSNITPFDLHIVNNIKDYFPQINSAASIKLDSELADALHQKNMEITNEIIKKNVLNQMTYLVNRVEEILMKFKNAPQAFTKFPLIDVIKVGSFQNGTMCAKKLSSDMVLILNYYPSITLINEFITRFDELISESVKREFIQTDTFMVIKVERNDKGFIVVGSVGSIFLQFAVRPEYLMYIQNPNVRKNMAIALASIRHANFIRNNANINVKILSRILRDISSRYKNLSVMTPWMFDLLSYYATFVNYNFQPLKLYQAFLRVFRLLSVGIFTPNSVGIMDPCENFSLSIHAHLNVDEQENLMKESQEILMEICKGNFYKVLGLKEESSNASVTEVDDVIEVKLETDLNDSNGNILKSSLKQCDSEVIIIEPNQELIIVE